MKKNLVSIIIPSRSDKFLQKTIDNLLQNAKGYIEIVIVLDGYWPQPMVVDDLRVKVLHWGGLHSNFGMRDSINFGVAASNGEFIMKIDEHCAVDEGFDVKLIGDYQDGCVVVPRRYRLNDVSWTKEDNLLWVDSSYLTYPLMNNTLLDGAEWRQWSKDRASILIDDCMIMQGSCYFMSRKHWDNIGGLDSFFYGKFHYEPQEIILKTWLGGGRIITNKKTWYAHRHRNRGEDRKYAFCNRQTLDFKTGKEELGKKITNHWIRQEGFNDLIKRFWPVPGWPENWEEELNKYKTTL
jgi:glycosyltransferase involved in cell wall biosynthesis